MKEPFPGLENEKDYHTIWKYTEQNHKEKTFEDTTEIHIIELSKYEEQKKVTNKLDPWLEFLVNPYGRRLRLWQEQEKSYRQQ